VNFLVMITKTEDGDIVPEGERKWCVLIDAAGSHMTLCSGEVFGLGEGAAEAQEKQVVRGGITCPICLRIVCDIKSIRL
jgi:hypothetical protein